MRWPKEYSDVRWWKAYAIYVVIAVPLVILAVWLIHGWYRWVIVAVISLAVMYVKDPIQRRVWR